LTGIFLRIKLNNGEELDMKRYGIAPMVLLIIFLTLFSGCGLFGTNNIENPNGDETTDSVVPELAAIVVLCNSPDSGLDPASRSSLIAKINRANVAYLSVQPCSAIEILDAFLEEVLMLRESSSPQNVQLYELGQSSISKIRLNNDCDDYPSITDRINPQ
jgi:hypothetical protein